MLLKNHVDTLLVISNDKLRHQFGNLKMKEAFAKADNVLATAAKCITDVINSTGQINVDFADVCTVMTNGGVAILGSAAEEGENRAQMAIENAINSPLLNDNDIRGAKWILININSSEGEHEFTMDEVEIIQNYLLSQAGDGTDVILGLGYDNSLGGKIGITLIATGFDHKDPFEKKIETKTEQRDEKIVMTLEMPVKELTAIAAPAAKQMQQPVLQFDEKDEAEQIAEITEPMAIQPVEDELMPTLKEVSEEIYMVELRGKTTGDKLDEAPVFFEISSASDQIPIIEFDIPQSPPPVDKPAKISKEIPVINKDASTPPSSGGYLAKPAQIYVEEQPKPESNSIDELLPVQENQQEDEPVIEMQLVVKSHQAAEEEQHVQTTQPIMISDVEEPAMQDETEELRRRAIDRIAKLRNLSFNINAADPNNEFETVPAYLRRNMELHNSIADVESFYSNYTVKTDDNNQAEISTLNSFLEGKKPD
jgi:cell division protein FtsZ